MRGEGDLCSTFNTKDFLKNYEHVKERKAGRKEGRRRRENRLAVGVICLEQAGFPGDRQTRPPRPPLLSPPGPRRTEDVKENVLAVSLVVLVSLLGFVTLSRGFCKDLGVLLFCLVMASCQYSLLKASSPRPPATPSRCAREPLRC